MKINYIGKVLERLFNTKIRKWVKVLKQGIEILRNINPAINNMGKTHYMREGLGVSWELATFKK